MWGGSGDEAGGEDCEVQVAGGGGVGRVGAGGGIAVCGFEAGACVWGVRCWVFGAGVVFGEGL